MDAYYALVVSVLVVSLGEIVQTELAQTEIVQTEVVQTEQTPVICRTGSGLDGTCVPRRLCDYGTVAIDMTLYAPKEFKNPCRISGNPDELINICCPHDSTIKVEATTQDFLDNKD